MVNLIGMNKMKFDILMDCREGCFWSIIRWTTEDTLKEAQKVIDKLTKYPNPQQRNVRIESRN